jgi:hypothetical protein
LVYPANLRQLLWDGFPSIFHAFPASPLPVAITSERIVIATPRRLGKIVLRVDCWVAARGLVRLVARGLVGGAWVGGAWAGVVGGAWAGCVGAWLLGLRFAYFAAEKREGFCTNVVGK